MNIKKCISLFLAFLLLVHYCGEEIASVSLRTNVLHPTEKGCCEKLVAKKDSCCKDKVVNF